MVVRALVGLVKSNPLYAGITIDQGILDRWPEDGIPSRIMNSIYVEADAEAEGGPRAGYAEPLSGVLGEPRSQEYGWTGAPSLGAIVEEAGTRHSNATSEPSADVGVEPEEDSLHVAYEQARRKRPPSKLDPLLCWRDHQGPPVCAGSSNVSAPCNAIEWDDVCQDDELGSQLCTGSVLSDVDKELVSFEPEVLRLLCSNDSHPASLLTPDNLDSNHCQPTTGGWWSKQASNRHCRWTEQGCEVDDNHQSTQQLLVFRQKSDALVNMYEDSSFFTACFPTLFWTGRGGHMEEHEQAVSYQSWAKWLMNHHSRR